MSVAIPLFKESSADFQQNIDLNNVNYTIRLTYNVRVGYWFMTLSTENYTITSVKCTLEFPILWQHYALMPELSGDFFINQIEDLQNRPDLTYDNFGSVFKLFYYTPEEVLEWRSANGL